MKREAKEIVREYEVGERVVVRVLDFQGLGPSFPNPYLVVAEVSEYRDRKILMGIKTRLMNVTIVEAPRSILRRATPDDEISLPGGNKVEPRSDSERRVMPNGEEVEIPHVEVEFAFIANASRRRFEKESDRQEHGEAIVSLMKKMKPIIDRARGPETKALSALADALNRLTPMIGLTNERVAFECMIAMIRAGSALLLTKSDVASVVDKAIEFSKLFCDRINQEAMEDPRS